MNAHRVEAARRCADRFGCVCLLKGADTIVAAPGQASWSGTPRLPGSRPPGTGDVLTGIVAAFLAKGLEPRLAAAAAAAAHAARRPGPAAARADRERRDRGAARRARL